MMTSRKRALLSSTMIPLVVAAGFAAGTAATVATVAPAAFAACRPCNPCAAKNPCNPCAANPCAAANPCNPCAAANPCNPCAAANPCNPCAAANPCAGANPCNPCAAANPCNPCAAANPCNPCAAGAGGGATECYVPRLQQAAANPCNPCAAANPCNPCAAATPCNPCAGANPCNPCAGANPCNPCAAANPCTPCAAANPCNPCAAANPCNPCAAGNPCNPCGAGGGKAELTPQEAVAVYDCLLDDLRQAYAKSGNPHAKAYLDWRRYSQRAYVSATHGGRYVQNYANPEAKAYGNYEKAGEMPAGAVLAKDSFTVSNAGRASLGPLFLMEKKAEGWNPASDDWRYTLLMPNGQLVGTTKGQGSGNVEFCINCHKFGAGDDIDSMFFLPANLRVK